MVLGYGSSDYGILRLSTQVVVAQNIVYHEFLKKTLYRGVRSLQKVGGHKNFQAENFSNRIMLSFWYEKVGGHLTHFI